MIPRSVPSRFSLYVSALFLLTSFCVCVFVCMSLSVCRRLFVFVCLFVCLCVSVRLCLFVCLSASPHLSLCISLFTCPPLPPSTGATPRRGVRHASHPRRRHNLRRVSNFSSPAVGVTVVSYAVNGVLQPLAAFSEVAAGQYAVQYTMLNSLDPWDGFLLQLSLSSNEHLETRVVPGSRHLLISTVHSDIAVGSGVGDIDNGAVPSACCRPFFASMSHFSRSRFCT